jgi:hypothetical protein
VKVCEHKFPPVLCFNILLPSVYCLPQYTTTSSSEQWHCIGVSVLPISLPGAMSCHHSATREFSDCAVLPQSLNGSVYLLLYCAQIYVVEVCDIPVCVGSLWYSVYSKSCVAVRVLKFDLHCHLLP